MSVGGHSYVIERLPMFLKVKKGKGLMVDIK